MTMRKSGLVGAIVLFATLVVLLLGPLRAQESAEESADETPAAETAAEENVSADNSLSFPVDI